MRYVALLALSLFVVGCAKQQQPEPVAPVQPQPQPEWAVPGQATYVAPQYGWFAQSVPEGQYSAGPVSEGQYSASVSGGQYPASQGVSLNPSVESAFSRGDVIRASAWIVTGDIDANPDEQYETDDDVYYSAGAP